MKPALYIWPLGLSVVAVLFFSAVTTLLLQQLFSHTTATSYAALPTTVVAEGSASSHTPSTVALPAFSYLTFTGDIMLARSVELWMKDQSAAYPFLNVSALVATNSAVMANFESAIPTQHVQTPSNVMRFSVDPQYIPQLRKSGITHVSLANNHSLDYGQTAYNNTRTVLAKNGITSFGHSTDLGSSSVTYLRVGSTTVSILAIHTLFVAPNPILLSQLIFDMKANSDIQVAYIHWGTEYRATHDSSQKTLAQYLVTLGVDAIIGHHPHVVEDIQVINGVPIFYSLGNFIFDQYFSLAVQNGLLVRLEITNRNLVYHLVPVTSLTSRSQPRAMTADEQTTFLTNLAAKSAPELSQSIKAGRLIFPNPLAAS